MNEKKTKKKLSLRKLSVTKLTDSTLTGVVGGPPSRTDCARPPSYYCTL